MTRRIRAVRLRCKLLTATLPRVGLGFSRRRLCRLALVSFLTLFIGGCARFGFELSLLEPSAAPDAPGCVVCDAGAFAGAGGTGGAGGTAGAGGAAGDAGAGGTAGAAGAGAGSATCSDGLSNQDETAIDCGG